MKYYITYPKGEEHEVSVLETNGTHSKVALNGKIVELDLALLKHELHVHSGNISRRIFIDQGIDNWDVASHDFRFQTHIENERERLTSLSHKASGASAKGAMIKSPMPGRILKILLNEGDEVHQGQAVIIVEAMKMENELFSEINGNIKKIFVQVGATVDNGTKLVEIRTKESNQ